MSLYEYINANMTSHRRSDYVYLIDELNRALSFFSKEFIMAVKSQKPVALNQMVSDWLLSEYNPKKSANIVELLMSISDVDWPWTFKRNSMFLYPLYYKAKLKDESREFIIKEIIETIGKLSPYTVIPAAPVTEWHRTKVFELKSPTSDSSGYLEAEYENKKGEKAEMVYTDIPNFCLYAYPRRLRGKKTFLVRDKWTELERELALWISKNEEFC